ncbi:IS1182 family transposase [Iamia sp.]|uniref:IS1182 family transposase n=1 Tax=Iamia sp. TaxID=2722710 RepID=UPI002BCE0F7F|nr:IS1182 family transposase [Iamia sp.]HXH59589.1 IS1182 family transposase [Iamia sp.]
MTVGLAPKQADLLVGSAVVCDGRVGESSIWAVLHRECYRLFPDEMFADLFSERGRHSVPPSIVAVVMVLQRLFGLSDREAVQAFEFDARWKYAAGGLDLDYGSFAHTVLVDMRARLDASASPRRIFEVTVEAAGAAGLVGHKRVLDSTPLYDAVATMDTVTLIRSAIRGLLKVADAALETGLRSVMTSGDDYASSSKPHIDWDDTEARAALIDTRARDAYACLAHLEGRELDAEVADAAALVATVVGQDLEKSEDGTFRIARRVAKDRVISTVDPEARHGHKTAARGFDGYKGHAATDPDSEIITNTKVTPGNAGDASAAEDLIEDLLAEADTAAEATAAEATADDSTADDSTADDVDGDGRQFEVPAERYDDLIAEAEAAAAADAAEDAAAAQPTVYGDAAYGTGVFQSRLEGAGIASGCKTQPPSAAGGRYTKDRFAIDLDAATVRCPNSVTVSIRPHSDGGGTASFAGACATCPLRGECTTSAGGRTISVGPHEATLARVRAAQADPAWKADYRSTRPKVERKLGHLMRRKHGGRRARVRGTRKVDADFNLLAAAVNLARLGVLGLRSTATGGWAATA